MCVWNIPVQMKGSDSQAWTSLNRTRSGPVCCCGLKQTCPSLWSYGITKSSPGGEKKSWLNGILLLVFLFSGLVLHTTVTYQDLIAVLKPLMFRVLSWNSEFWCFDDITLTEVTLTMIQMLLCWAANSFFPLRSSYYIIQMHIINCWVMTQYFVQKWLWIITVLCSILHYKMYSVSLLKTHLNILLEIEKPSKVLLCVSVVHRVINCMLKY